MVAITIDGKAIAERLRADVAAEVAVLTSGGRPRPGLAVVLVGEDPASRIYVGSKIKHTHACGMASFEHRLDADISETRLMSLIGELNADPRVHGILVQLPLPRHIDSGRVIQAISPAKDVDGFHPENAGRLMSGIDGFVPCTPMGSLRLLESLGRPLAGLDAVVVGRSNIVGKPMSLLLLQRDCSVTTVHSRSRDLPGICRRADILVAAVGRPNMIRGDWIKPGATVIDVGINRIETDGRARIVGDVAFEEAVRVAGAITPVPGGVGPMTIACLLANTLLAARRADGAAS